MLAFSTLRPRTPITASSSSAPTRFPFTNILTVSMGWLSSTILTERLVVPVVVVVEGVSSVMVEGKKDSTS